MPNPGRVQAVVAILLAAPLVALVGWIVSGGLSRSFGPEPAGGSAVASAPTPGPASRAPDLRIEGLGPPDGDYPPERLWERVDGAADALIAAGCRRLVVWKTGHPASDLEVLFFDTAEGAGRVLARDAGSERVPGPGDEAATTDQSVLFRRGRHYVRILADPTTPPDPAGLLELARKVDSAIQVLAGGGGP